MDKGRRDYNTDPMSWLADLRPGQKFVCRFTPYPDGRMQIVVVPKYTNWLTLDLVAKCEQCPKIMPAGRAIHRFAPTETNFAGTWSCSCGGTARVPEIYAIVEHDGHWTIVRDEDRAQLSPSPPTLLELARLARELRDLRDRQPQVDAELQALQEHVRLLDERVSALELERAVVATAPTAAPLILRILRDPAFSGSVSALALLVSVLAIVLGVA